MTRRLIVLLSIVLAVAAAPTGRALRMTHHLQRPMACHPER